MLPYMDRPADTRAGLQAPLHGRCYGILQEPKSWRCATGRISTKSTCSHGSKEPDNRAGILGGRRKDKPALDKENAARAAAGTACTKPTKFETDKAKLRQTIRNAHERSYYL